jgi:hypothetical protein
MPVSMSVSAGLTGAYLQVGSFIICRGLEQHDKAECRSITGFRQPGRCSRVHRLAVPVTNARDAG